MWKLITTQVYDEVYDNENNEFVFVLSGCLMACFSGQLLQIPPVWKRVTAEFVDFFVLFLIKLAVTILTVEYVGIV